MKIGIVGAGFAGIASAKVLTEFGHKVQVFEKENDVGGVWSVTRRYPGLGTQNVRSTYAMSDFPYPKGTPEWPSGEEVQQYIEAYAKKFNVFNKISFNTEVTLAKQSSNGSWSVEISKDGKKSAEDFDYLIVANGIFSDPFIPEWRGADAFKAAGGKIMHTVDFHNLEDVRGKNVVVIGYGKSSCDAANATVGTAKKTTIVARHLIWKVPKRLNNVLNYKMLLLTRMGEALFPYIELKGAEAFLHGKGKKVSAGMLGSVQGVIEKQFKLEKLGLHPKTGLDTIVRSTVSLATDGFFKNIKAGKLFVERDTEITSMAAGKVTLSNGKVLDADYVICGTGFLQGVPFLDASVMKSINDERGNFRLYRQLIPLEVTNLAFNGYNSSFFSQLNAEVGAIWLAANIEGAIKLPTKSEMLSHIDNRLAWMEKRTENKHARGTNIIPFSVHNIDELLRDLKLQIPAPIRFNQWLLPINPKSYAKIGPKLRKRLNKK
ncbi:MAG: NAD(P)-binding domain-containing protein [SAR202 cluster bacterium]|nr:NAD(P)-binding domain-containing protein [SAR202 cluster bacterium]